MYEEPKEKNSLVQEASSRVDMPTRHLSSFSVFFDKVHSVNGLHLLSAVSQIILGSLVLALSVLGVIQHAWIAALMTIFGSASTIGGLYFMYYVFTHTSSFDSLLNSAIKRVINEQN